VALAASAPATPDRRTLVHYERRGHVAIIHMNRPERLNALSVSFMADLDACWRRFLADDEAWVGVLTGEGRAFSTGMDITERLEGGPPKHSDVPYWDYNLFWEERIDKPTIAAVQGYAYGGGFFFVTRCDLRIAARSAKFQVTEPIRGGIAGYELQLLENLPSTSTTSPKARAISTTSYCSDPGSETAQYEQPAAGRVVTSMGEDSAMATRSGWGQRCWPSMRMPKWRWGPVLLPVEALSITCWPASTRSATATAWLPGRPWQ